MLALELLEHLHPDRPDARLGSRGGWLSPSFPSGSCKQLSVATVETQVLFVQSREPLTTAWIGAESRCTEVAEGNRKKERMIYCHMGTHAGVLRRPASCCNPTVVGALCSCIIGSRSSVRKPPLRKTHRTIASRISISSGHPVSRTLQSS